MAWGISVAGSGVRADMTMMFVIHDAMRRDLARFAAGLRRLAAGSAPAGLAAALGSGWAEFAAYLHEHHTHEDEELWPALLDACPAAGRVVEAMEAEHGVVTPLLAKTSAAMADPTRPVPALDALTALVEPLTSHLAHEEQAAVPLAEEYLADFLPGFEQRRRKEAGLRGLTRFMPWVLDGADPERAAWLLGQLPPPVRLAVRYFLRRRVRATAALRLVVLPH
jgi:iron-sulfur cluster repair protein YtfE (RIC family)